MPAKEVELLSIAFDASYTHMYAPGCVAQGVAACNLGVPILAEELARHRDKKVGRTHE